jgi:hypothetical protein
MYTNSCIVVDLDDTLLTYNDKPTNGALEFLDFIETYFTYKVIWTYGNTPHLKKSLKILKCSDLFDLKLSRIDTLSNKDDNDCKLWIYVKHLLNKELGATTFGFTVLVDNDDDNFNNDYDLFCHFNLKSQSLNCVRKRILQCMQDYYKE